MPLIPINLGEEMPVFDRELQVQGVLRRPPKGRIVEETSPLLQKVKPSRRFSEKFYRNRFRSVSNESSLREMSALSSYVVYLPSSVIRKYSRRMESSLD